MNFRETPGKIGRVGMSAITQGDHLRTQFIVGSFQNSKARD